MRERAIGSTGRQVSELGFGAGGYWGLKVFDESVARSLVDVAIDNGVNLFDTGPNYSNGNAEGRLGNILGRRVNKFFIATKGGTHFVRGRHIKDYSYAGLTRSLEQSLRRLGRDDVDLFQLHDMPDTIGEETLRFIQDIKSSGRTKLVGVSTDVVGAGRALDMKIFDVIMLEYNILERRGPEGIIKRADEAGVGVLVKSPLAQTLYSRKIFRVRSLSDFWYLARAIKNHRHKIIEGVKYRFINDHATPLRFVLANPGVTSAIVGTTSLAHLQFNCDAVKSTIDSELLARIKRVA